MPDRHEHADPFVGDAPQDERQDTGRGPVDPLEIVDRDDQGRIGREARKGVGGGERDRPRIDRATGCIGSEQRRIEGLAEGDRHPASSGIRGLTEEIAKRGIGQPGLRLRAATLQLRGSRDPRPRRRRPARAWSCRFRRTPRAGAHPAPPRRDRGTRRCHGARGRVPRSLEKVRSLGPVAQPPSPSLRVSCATARAGATLMSTNSLGIPYDARVRGNTAEERETTTCPTPSPPSPRPSCRRRG